MITCGIDASSSCTGVCIFDDKELIYYEKFKPKKVVDFRHNTCDIIDMVIDVVNLYCPDIIYMEDVPTFVNKKRGVKPLIALGAVQGIFYRRLVYDYGYNVKYIAVSEWRKELDFLKGARGRDDQKAKAVEFANKIYGLQLKKSDDDIAEAICLTTSQIYKDD